MDTYFDKLDPKALKREDELEDESDDEDTKNFEAAAGGNRDELAIYESKDPYVLRSLPYLIGSTGYLDNDHVGLKDLESEDEEEEAEEEPMELQKSSESSSEEEESEHEEEREVKKRVVTKKDDYSEEDESEEEPKKVVAPTEKKKPKKEENLFEESDDEDDDGIFNLGGKIVCLRVYFLLIRYLNLSLCILGFLQPRINSFHLQ